MLFLPLYSHTACAKFPNISLCELDGSGTEADPYILCDYADLTEKLQDSANLSAHFVMYADIDARESWSQGTADCTPFDGSNEAATTCEGWEPVGSFPMGTALCSGPGASCFTGRFNGRGHTVSDLWIKRDDSTLGFFGAVTASNPDTVLIHDITLRDVHIDGGDAQKGIGGLVGLQSGGTIENNSYATGEVNGGTGNDRVGGLAGQQQNGNITNSYAAGNVNGEGGDDNAGGLVGQQTGGTTENSYAAGNVDGGGQSGDEDGGLTGDLGSSATISGINYYVDTDGTDGIGTGSTCANTVCIQETDTTGFSTIFGALFSAMGMGWDDTMEWTNRMTAHPCVPDIDFGPGNGCPP